MDDADSAGAARKDAGVPLWGPRPVGSVSPPTEDRTVEFSPAPEPPPPSLSVAEPVGPLATDDQKSNGAKVFLIGGIVAFVAVTAVVVVSFVRTEDEPSANAPAPTAFPVTSNALIDPTATRATPTATRFPVTPTRISPSSPTLSSASLPPGYRSVTGPNGIVVAIPEGWPVTAGSLSTHVQAEDPASPGSLVRYGASTSEARPLLDAVASNETDNSGIKNGYQRIKLASVPSATGVEIVEWEFLYNANDVQRHALGRYWRRGGLDYIVYGAANVPSWSSMRLVLDTMVRTAGPVA